MEPRRRSDSLMCESIGLKQIKIGPNIFRLFWDQPPSGGAGYEREDRSVVRFEGRIKISIKARKKKKKAKITQPTG